MSTDLLDKINSPQDIKALDAAQLEQLAIELRAKMIGTCSVRGGHLASSLGAVELIIALHRVLDCPHDRIIFDVGHQAYAHKLLTGRNASFETLRTLDGISGFPKIEESPYDVHDSGHASDSISAALGYAYARDIDGSDETIVAFIGDASISGGMSFEALNQIASRNTKLIIVLNDNGMSISKNVGGMAASLAQARLSKRYINVRDSVEDAVSSKGKVGKFLMDTGNAFKESFKQLVLPSGMLFEQLGLTYVGPVNGHDIQTLEELFKETINFDGPIIIHAVTTKGKGYEPAEHHPDLFHGVGAFDVKSGKPFKPKSKTEKTWTSVFSEELVDAAKKNKDIVAITAAMSHGTGLSAFAKKYPKRFFDVGIAEEHAVTMAASLASAGKIPVVAIYSTFLQRAYDQIMINVALQKQHVVFCLDRAGLVGEDGPTHHGAFDISYLRSIPEMTILAPADEDELRSALHFAIDDVSGPVAIRYPRGSVVSSIQDCSNSFSTGARMLLDGAGITNDGAGVITNEGMEIASGGADVTSEGTEVAILSIGSCAQACLQAAKILASKNIFVAVWDMRFVKPLSKDVLEQVANKKLIVTVEENSLSCGFGSAVLEMYADLQIKHPQVLRLGLPDSFAPQGSLNDLHKLYGLDASGIAKSIVKALER